MAPEESHRFAAIVDQLHAEFGKTDLLISHSAKDPHRLGSSRVLVRGNDGSLEPMEEASHFIRHLTRIDQYRVYSAPHLRDAVAASVRQHLSAS